jgi:hypothetical protein
MQSLNELPNLAKKNNRELSVVLTLLKPLCGASAARLGVGAGVQIVQEAVA